MADTLTVIKVLTEPPASTSRFRSGSSPQRSDVLLFGACISHAPPLFLQHPENRTLHGGDASPISSRNRGATVGQLKATRTIPKRPVNAPASRAKEFAFEQSLRDGAAVDVLINARSRRGLRS